MNSLSPRLENMREMTIKEQQQISTVRAQAFTEVIRESSDLPKVQQMALGFARTLERLPVSLTVDERIAGAATEKMKAAILFPEMKSDFLLRELDNFSERERDRFTVSAEEKRILRTEVLPYWDGTSAFDNMVGRQPETIQHAMRHVLFVINNDFGGGGLLAGFDLRNVLERGLDEMLAEVRRRERELSVHDAEAGEQRTFYRSLSIVAEAILGWARRYAERARELAATAGPAAARELSEIANALDHAPARPARGFREALQTFWLLYLAIGQLDGPMELPFGRLDQMLGPYYAADIAAGRLTREDARELVAELFIKTNRLTWLAEYAATKVIDGNNQRLTLTVGGVDAAGNDATNELSLIIVETIDALHLVQPNLAVRLHAGTPDLFRNAVNEVMTGGGNVLQVFNDAPIVTGLRRLGFPVAVSRDYILTGCVQPIPVGAFGPTCAASVNMPKSLELTLNGGEPFFSMSDEARDLPLPAIGSFEDLLKAYETRLRATITQVMAAMRVVADIEREYLPNPVLSLFLDGPLQSGRDIKSGGARHNMTGITLIGLGTVIDSLAAINNVVFTQKTHTLAEVVEWIKSDFEGYENERELLQSRAPKFGNDEPGVDALARRLVDIAADVLASEPTPRGGVYALGLHSETHHIYQGLLVAATPDGRKASAAMSPGCGPTSGMDTHGPTASLRSAASLDHTRVMGGASMNLRLSPLVLQSKEQRGRFEDLLKGYFQLGGQHLQLNVIDTATLREAQAHPERFQDLFVRVTGYSARFVDLTDGTQEEIIQRTEMQACR